MGYRISLLLFLAISTGCTTSRSTMLNRHEDGLFTKNCDVPTRGIPITLKVPTHLDVTIIETYYLEDRSAGETKFADLREVPMNGHRNLTVETKTIETEKVFTVDWIRPAAGVLEYGAVKWGTISTSTR